MYNSVLQRKTERRIGICAALARSLCSRAAHDGCFEEVGCIHVADFFNAPSYCSNIYA